LRTSGPIDERSASVNSSGTNLQLGTPQAYNLPYPGYAYSVIAERREAMLVAVESSHGFNEFRCLIERYLDNGIPSDEGISL